MRPRFTLTALLLGVTFVGLVLAIVVPLWRWRNRDQRSVIVSDLDVSADGSTIAALMADGTLHIWHRDRSEPQTTIATQSRMFGYVAVSPDGRYAATSSGYLPRGTKSTHEVHVWDLRTHALAQRISAGAASRLAFAPNGNWFAIWQPGAAPVRVFDVRDGWPAQPYFDIQKCRASAFSSDGDKLCVMTDNGHLRIYDVPSQMIDAEFDAKTNAPHVQLAWSPDDQSVVAFSAANPGKGPAQIDAWLLAGRHQSAMVDSKSRAKIGFLPTSGVLVAPDGFELKFLDPVTLKPVGPHKTLSGKTVTNVAMPHRGEFFVLASVGNIWTYDATTYQHERHLLQPPRRPNVSLAVAGLAIWFIVFKLSRARMGERTCPVCGHLWQPAGKNRTEIVCPACYAKMTAGSLVQISAERRRQQMGNVFAYVVAFCEAIAVVILGVTFKVGFWVIILLLGVCGFIVSLILFAITQANVWWRRRCASTLAADVAMAEKASDRRGLKADIGAMMVWSAEGTSLTDVLRIEIKVVRERLAAAIGRQVPAPAARTFVFADDVALAIYLSHLGLQVDPHARGQSLYVGGSYQRLLLCERHVREQNIDLRTPLRSLLVLHLLEVVEGRIPAGWIHHGLMAALAHENEHHELERLNRRVVAGLAAGRTISAVEFSHTTSQGSWKKYTRHGRHDDFVWCNQFAAQSWSLTEFLCGRGATPERRVAFQGFFNDADRRKRPAGAIARHFGCPFDELLELWQGWVDEQGIGEHRPPPQYLATYLLKGPIAKTASRETPPGERISAIRELGEQGWLLGADRLTALLHGADDEMCAEAAWALECISGRVLGSSPAAWEAWWETVAMEPAARA